MPAKAVNGRSSFNANQPTSFFLVSGFGSGAYSAQLLNGTRQRLFGASPPRQSGDDVLRMLVTGGPPDLRGARPVEEAAERSNEGARAWWPELVMRGLLPVLAQPAS